MKSFADLKIVFMGTPEFAVASLDALVEAGARIVGVVTAPDKPAGRGLQLQQSAVKKYAVEKGLTVLQPVKLKDPAFIESLRELQADLQIVVAFRMLPEIVWNMPPMGSVNVHGSLLPQYRGAAPINWAVINGDSTTGVTTFKLKHEIDTGDILLQASMPIGENETAGEVHDKMKELGATLLVQTVQGIAAGTIREQPQASSQEPLKHAPKLYTETCHINFSLPVKQVHDLVRGLSPFPGAFTHLKGKTLKIYRSMIVPEPNANKRAEAGAWKTDGKTYLYFACADGWLSVLELQLEGKKKMPVTDFLRGFRFE